MINIIYPARVRIVDAGDSEIIPGLKRQTPTASKPHLGKEGTAELIDDVLVKITLDDGSILMGHECWWIPLGQPVDLDESPPPVFDPVGATQAEIHEALIRPLIDQLYELCVRHRIALFCHTEYRIPDSEEEVEGQTAIVSRTPDGDLLEISDSINMLFLFWQTLYER